MLIEKHHVLIWASFKNMLITGKGNKKSFWKKLKSPLVNVTFLIIILCFGVKALLILKIASLVISQAVLNTIHVNECLLEQAIPH